MKEYAFEKWRLLRTADPTLADSSVIALVIHGMTRHYQRQIQVRSLTTMDGLLLALIYAAYPEYRSPVWEMSVGRGDYRDKNTATSLGREKTSTDCNRHCSVTPNVQGQDLDEEKCTVEETVFLTKTGILSVQMLLDGRTLSVLLDTGASVSLFNESLVDADNIVRGKKIRVCGYDGSCREYNRWTSAYLEFEGEKLKVQALVVPKVNFDFILSRPDMKRMKIIIFWNDFVTIGRGCHQLHIA